MNGCALAVLGSTGSIGTQTLDVVRRNPGCYTVPVLTAGKNLALLEQQIAELKPLFVAVCDAEDAAAIRPRLPRGTELGVGEEGMRAAAVHPAADTVVAAIMGYAALHPVLAAIEAGKNIALANKECLVAAGPLVREALARSSATVVPVDSEHSSIFQCLLRRGRSERIERITLTASGGPFLRTPAAELAAVTPEQAVNHPRWRMGAKISVDSATLMNKGLEVIEAAMLFDLPGERIDVLVHPESLVHGFVEYGDGAVLAALFEPDMRVPIAYALSYLRAPRLGTAADGPAGTMSSGVTPLALARRGAIHFEQPDHEKFPLLQLAYAALRSGGTAPTVLNAANEIAVSAFLDRQIRFTDIPLVVGETLQSYPGNHLRTIADIVEADSLARRAASEWISRR